MLLQGNKDSNSNYFDPFFSTTTTISRSSRSDSTPSSLLPLVDDDDDRHHKFQTNSASSAVQNAIQQVHALMDLYETTTTSTTTSTPTMISSDIITTAIEGVVQKVYRDKTFITNDQILPQLEATVWRLYDKLQVPLLLLGNNNNNAAVGVLQTLLSMQQQTYERQLQHVEQQQRLLMVSSSSSSSVSSSSSSSVSSSSMEILQQNYVDRATKLLLCYYNQHQQRQQRGRKIATTMDPTIPSSTTTTTTTTTTTKHLLHLNKDVMDIVQFAKSSKLTMTPQLWELVSHVRQHEPNDSQLLRDLLSETLVILAHSSAGREQQQQSTWMEHQFEVLQTLDDSYQATNNTLFRATEEELELALVSAATLGDARRATRIFRRLYHYDNDDDRRQRSSSISSSAETRRRRWRWLMESYAQSNETGSIAYMERLVRSQKELHHRDIYNIVLKARANNHHPGLPGTGLCAETFLTDMLRLGGGGREEDEEDNKEESSSLSVQPNTESLYYAVTAYLNEQQPTPLFQNVLDADALVRRLSLAYNITLYSNVPTTTTTTATNWRSSKTTNNNNPYPVVAKLLEAYSSLATTTTTLQDTSSSSNNRVVKAAENLYRFFLARYREGRINETPTERHLALMLDILNRRPTKGNAKTSVELFLHFEKFHHKATNAATDTPNLADILRCLLDTLAKSGQKGYGNFAEGLFERSKGAGYDIKPDDRKDMLQCVAQCRRVDGNEDRAIQLLQLNGLDNVESNM